MLQFHNGQFKIMQVAGIQEVPCVSPDTVRLLEGALEREKPDLVIFTGDQLKGGALCYQGHPEQAQATIYNLLKPVMRRKMPFMVTYGNNDYKCGLNARQQHEIYAQYPGFLSGTPRSGEDVGTADLLVYNEKGTEPVLHLYLVDTEKSKRDSGDAEQIGWYRGRRDLLRETWGRYIPSVVFQYGSVPEVYEALHEVSPGTKGAVEAHGTHRGRWFVLPDRALKKDAFLREAPAYQDKNTKRFTAFAEKGDVLGIYWSSDCSNSFAISYGGTDLGCTQGAGFHSYGPGRERGIRVFTFSEENPEDYETGICTYRDLFGNKPLCDPAKELLYRCVPANLQITKPDLITVGKSAAVIAAAYGVYRIFKDKK